MSDVDLRSFRSQRDSAEARTKELLGLEPEPLERFLEPRIGSVVANAAENMTEILISVRNYLFPNANREPFMAKLREEGQFEALLDARRQYMREFFERDRAEVANLKSRGEMDHIPEAEAGEDEDGKVEEDANKVRALLEIYKDLLITFDPNLYSVTSHPSQSDLILDAHKKSVADQYKKERGSGKMNDEYGHGGLRGFFVDKAELPDGWEWNQNSSGVWVLDHRDNQAAYQVIEDTIAFSPDFVSRYKAPRIPKAQVIRIESQLGTTQGRGLYINPDHVSAIAT